MRKSVPSYRQRNRSNQAVVTLLDTVTRERRDYYLGEFDTPESRERYHRLIAVWESSGRRLPTDEDNEPPDKLKVTVEEIAGDYWEHAQSYYTPSEAGAIKTALRIVRRMFGSTPATSFGPKALRVVRDSMVRGDSTETPPRAPWCRKSVNKQVHRIGAMFKWAAGQEMIPVTVYQQLKTLEPLKRGRTDAPETEPIKPVPDHLVDPIKPFVASQVWALIQVQRLTGSRCGELFGLRPVDLQMNLDTGIWTFTPSEHKTAHHGHSRTIYFGPKAQEVIKPFLAGRAVDRCLFRPAEAEQEHRMRRRAQRKTPANQGNGPGTNCKDDPQRTAGECYCADSFRRAIHRGCDHAFQPPEHLARIKVKAKKGQRWETTVEWQERLGPKRWAELLHWREDHRWHPHQLRHAAATSIRRQFGLEAAQITLGHSSALVTEAVYAERDMEKVLDVMRKIG